MTKEEYLNLITSEYRQQPKFMAVITMLVDIFTHIQDVYTSMIPKFDLDIAIGDQLDIIGQWVGISRNIKIPISGVFFSWDGTDVVGWDYGIWRGNTNSTDITVLPDDIYRNLIKSKIAANSWGGTTEAAYRIWDELFPSQVILIQDHEDMSYDLILLGETIDSLTISLLTQGYIQLKPEGVRVNYYYVGGGNKMFAWDLESEYAAGWDDGYWLQSYNG